MPDAPDNQGRILHHTHPKFEKSHLRSTDLCMVCAPSTTIPVVGGTERFRPTSFEELDELFQSHFNTTARPPTLNHSVEVQI